MKPFCSSDDAPKLTNFFNEFNKNNIKIVINNIPITNSDVKCIARAGPGGSFTDCFKAPFTIILLSFLYLNIIYYKKK
jgi:hypothetical protein